MTSHATRHLLASGVTLFAVVLSIPPLRALIEQSMVWHMVIQMPLLVAAGWLFARALPPSTALLRCNRMGLTSAIASQLILAYWMLPLAIDHAIVLPLSDMSKILSLLLCGFTLRDTFLRAPAVVQIFFAGYNASMLLGLGLYFIKTEQRLCNAYSQDSQISTGLGLIALVVLTAALWLVSFLTRTVSEHSGKS